MPSSLRLAFRSIARRPLLSAGIMLTLGLALGATLLVLGLLDSYLLRPLPYGDDSRLTVLTEYPLSAGPGSIGRLTFGNAADIADRVGAFSRTAIVRNESCLVRTDGGTEAAFIQRVTPDFFPMLGLRAQLGEVINAANAETGGQRALLLSHEFWRRRLGGRPDVIGTSLPLDNASYRIVGVLPPDTLLPIVGEGQQGWVAMLPQDFQRGDRSVRRHFMFGELAPGRTLGSAQGELSALAATLRRDYPATNADKGLAVVGLRDALVGGFRRQLIILQASVALVLVVACVNAGCLLVAQAIRRRREFAVRLALGAGTADLLRQFFGESVILALGGAGLGLLTAGWLAPLTAVLLPATDALRRLPPPSLSPLVVGVSFGLALLIAAAFSLVPLLQARRLNLEATLRSGSRQQGNAAGGAATRLLVSLQVAIALALLVTAVQLVRSFRALQQVDRGIPAGQLYSFRLGTRGVRYADPAARVRYYENVIANLNALPHIAAGATVDYALPAVPQSYFTFYQEGDSLSLADSPKRLLRRFASVSLLETLQLKVLSGRWIADTDRADTPRVAVVSQSLADKYWPGRDPIGRRIRIEGAGDGWWEIVGTVSNTLGHGPQPVELDSVFLPHTQGAPLDTGAFVRVRGSQPLTKEQVDQAVTRADPENSAYLFASVSDFYANSAWQTRFSLVLVGAFAGLAVTLCLTGVYAVLAFAVAGRTPEFGVRLALGASRPVIARLVLRDALRMTATGLVLGTLLAFLTTRSIGNLLFGVAPLELSSYAGTFLLLALSCLAACAIPVWRATRVDPMVALRAE